MCKTIDELWHGNIAPQTDCKSSSPEMQQLMEYMTRHHDELMNGITDEQKETLEKLDDCWSEYINLSEKAIFSYAFKLGARLTYEALCDNSDLI